MSAGGDTGSGAGSTQSHLGAFADLGIARFDIEDLLVDLLDRVRQVLNTDTAAVLLLDSGGQQLVATAASGLEQEVRQGVRIPVGAGFAGRIAAQKKPVILDEVNDANVVNPILQEIGIRSLLGVPLLVKGTLIGVLHVGTLTPRRFTSEDSSLLESVSEWVGIAVRARLSEIARAAAATLQRSLLQSSLPVTPGVEFAARYVPAEQGVGGDWYDVFALPSGWLCLAIGDVAGHGLEAAVSMIRFRTALRSYAIDSMDPAETLAKVDRGGRQFLPDAMATVLYVMVEPSFDRLHVSSAGHPPPMLALPGHPAVLLDIPIDPPLGVTIEPRRRTSTIDVPPGALLCFFTDGLVERRDASLDDGLERLRSSLMAGPAESACASVMSRLVGVQEPIDDIALLVLRRQPTEEIGALDLQMPASPRALAHIRSATRRWLHAVGLYGDGAADLLVAIGEACANTVEHAYGPRGGTVRVRIELQPPDVVATVSDTGHYRPSRGKNGGRGTLLMQALTDEVTIDHGPQGTDITLRSRLMNSSKTEPSS
jgi:anti-sigma regulatory factor (Ser/Thr protein kinase)/putative methionine-R-sulfoxide reductase with GAF domain